MGASTSPLRRARRLAGRVLRKGRRTGSAPRKRDAAAFDAMTVPVVPLTVDGVLRPARVLPDARFDRLSRSNLDLVVDAANAAGVEYFLLPDRKAPSQHQIGILDTDAAAFADALRAQATGRPVYVQSSTPGSPEGRARWIGSGSVFGTDRALRVMELHTSGPRGMRLGANWAAHVELWRREEDGTIVGPRRNELGATLGPDIQQAATTTIAAPTGTPADEVARAYRTLAPFTSKRIDDIDFDIDIVYTWVDGSDPAWIERKNKRGAEFGVEALNPMAANSSRYKNRDELRYSLRSIEMFAPWVRKVFVVTDQQRPDWLVGAHPRLEVVDHRDLFPDPEALPTFNSHAIESRLHHIEGLAEHYLYFNDDVMFGRPVTPQTFFLSNGIWKYFVARAQVDLGAPDLDGKPITAAGKNNRQIIEELFGRTLTVKMKHTPHAARRSVLLELEERVPTWFEAVAHHPFRHPGDISVATSLGHYYAHCTGRAVPGELSYAYADIAVDPVAEMFREWKSTRRLDTFCVNDTETSDEQHEQLAPLVADFFERYFPFRSTFEK